MRIYVVKSHIKISGTEVQAYYFNVEKAMFMSVYGVSSKHFFNNLFNIKQKHNHTYNI